MKSFLFALITSLLFASATAMAGDVAAGKAKSAICASCHGADGKSLNPLWPNLAGQKEQYLAKQIKAFRDGTRPRGESAQSREWPGRGKGPALIRPGRLEARRDAAHAAYAARDPAEVAAEVVEEGLAWQEPVETPVTGIE